MAYIFCSNDNYYLFRQNVLLFEMDNIYPLYLLNIYNIPFTLKLYFILTDIMSKLEDVDHVGYPINNESQLCLSLAKTLETSMGGSSGAVSY